MLTTAFRAFSKTGEPEILFLLCFALASALAWRRHVVPALFVCGSLLGAWAIAVVVKEEVHRARPALEDPIATSGGFAFPSGHASLGSAFYGAVLIVAWPLLPGPRVRALCAAATAALLLGIGLSRLYLGLHWLADVLAGFCVGVGVLAIGLLLEPGVRRLIGSPPAAAGGSTRVASPR